MAAFDQNLLDVRKILSEQGGLGGHIRKGFEYLGRGCFTRQSRRLPARKQT